MAKAGRPFLNASRRRVETIGDALKTMSTVTGDSSPQGGTAGTSVESGETYIITAPASASRTITLPPLSKGAWVKIVWGVNTTATDGAWVIATSNSEVLNGHAFWYDSNADGRTDDICHVNYRLGDGAGGGTDTQITINDDVQAGSMLTLFSDGLEWYTMENHLISQAVLVVA